MLESVDVEEDVRPFAPEALRAVRAAGFARPRVVGLRHAGPAPGAQFFTLEAGLADPP